MATGKNSTTASPTMAISSTNPHQFRNVPKIQDFHLVWLDRRTDTVSDNHFGNSITDFA
jgi:hypothetical protein